MPRQAQVSPQGEAGGGRQDADGSDMSEWPRAVCLTRFSRAPRRRRQAARQAGYRSARSQTVALNSAIKANVIYELRTHHGCKPDAADISIREDAPYEI